MQQNSSMRLHGQAKDWDAVVKGKSGEKRRVNYHTLRRHTKNAIDRRRYLAKQIYESDSLAKNLVGNEKAVENRRMTKLKEDYKEAKKAAVHLARVDRIKAWHKSIAKYASQVSRGDSSQYWRWIAWVSGRRNTTIQRNAQPIFDPTLNRIVYNPSEIGKAWADHYTKLAADIGHSRFAEID